MGDDDAETIRRGLAAHGYAVESVRLLGAGLDHAAYEVDGGLIVRVAIDADRAARVAREAALLAAVAAVVPVPVPTPVLTDADHGCLAYRKLPGRPALELADAWDHAPELGRELGRFLAVLHGQPTEAFAALVAVDDTPPASWLAETAHFYTSVRPYVPSQYAPVVADFLATAPPAATRQHVLAHNDLGIEHVLVNPTTWRITGVIDWSDAALTDPARDLGLVLRDLGPAALEAALQEYRPSTDSGLTARARFYARCGALEDLSFGVTTGNDAYVAKTLRSLEWLFPSAR